MRRAACILAFLATVSLNTPLAHADELSIENPETSEVLLEAATSTPDTEPLTENIELQADENSTPQELFSIPQLQTIESPYIFNQPEADNEIVFDGAGGFSEHYLRPESEFTALSSGRVSKIRLYLARNDQPFVDAFTVWDRNSNQLYISVNDSRNGASCTLFYAGEQTGGQTEANFSLIPVGDASNVRLIQFDNPVSDCVLEQGIEYGVRLYNRVMGEGGTIYTKGADSEGKFFLQAVADDFPLEEPEPPLCAEPCISNILFLPGIKGSRLYSGDGKVWEPSNKEDLEKLFLAPDGSSIRSDIHTKQNDVIDEIPGSKIYDSFLRDLATMYDERTVNDWEAVSYDWRLSLDELMTKGTERDGDIFYTQATSTPYIEQTLRRLAANSKTGKVTVVAHSNGGLVAKALMQKLGDAETESLVDKVIFVAVPQSGAPQSLGALLFGLREGIPNDFLPLITPVSTARQFAENSPMAYRLLPTTQYLEAIHTDDPHAVIRFDGNQKYEKEREVYGLTIDSQPELHDYLLAAENGRAKPAPDDISSPNVLNPLLLSLREEEHASIDTWVPPPNVTLYEIAGWGADTIAGVQFYDICIASICKLEYRPTFTEDGDGVVPTPSALMLPTSPNIHHFWFDLDGVRKQFEKKYDHGNMLETEPLRSFVEDILKDIDTRNDFISQTRPSRLRDKDMLIFILHSPLTISLYDKDGNHTGLNTEGLIDEEVTGTDYGEFGETKYILAPTGSEYHLRLEGQAEGSFSLDIQELRNGKLTTSSISNIPTTSETLAEMTLGDLSVEKSALLVDYEGDGVFEISLNFSSGTTTYFDKSSDESSRGGSFKDKTSVAPEKISPTIPNTEFTSVESPKKIGYQTQPTTFIPLISAGEAAEIPETSEYSYTKTASVYNAFLLIQNKIETALYTIYSFIRGLFKSLFS